VKISSFGKHPGDPVSPPVKKTSSKDFSSFMDMANRDKQEQHLKEMLDKIMKLGEKIKAAPILKDIKEYKRQISDYLTFVLKNYYKVSRDYLYSSSNILLRVDVLNKKIDELVHQFLENQKDNLRLIKSVDEISGLLLDLYN